MTIIGKIFTQPADGPHIDAFGRARVSNTGQRFDVEFIYDKQPQLMTELGAGTGSVAHNTTSRDVSLLIGDTDEESFRDFQQNFYNPYTPGNSQQIDITGTLNAANIEDGVMEIFYKNGVDSSEQIFAQSLWTDLKKDENWQFSHIFQIDFQSLKVGRIRFNIVKNGIPYNVLQITNDNKLKNGYWQYPALPVRFKIYNTATETITELGYYDDDNGVGFRFRVPLNAEQELVAICATVKSEGGKDLFDIPGFPFPADRGITPITVADAIIPVPTMHCALLLY